METDDTPSRAREPEADARAVDRRLNMELDQTFPASDPIPWIREGSPAGLYLEDFSVGRKFLTGDEA